MRQGRVVKGDAAVQGPLHSLASHPRGVVTGHDADRIVARAVDELIHEGGQLLGSAGEEDERGLRLRGFGADLGDQQPEGVRNARIYRLRYAPTREPAGE